jgi:DNA polymerase-3 subunit gamma/tau
VAKVAGSDSSLLQISSDERERVGRVAELFSEEDLSRHLQIMLRTHGELGYRQEQRFHLELGLLKMTHAQRLLPIEQLLSEAAAGMAGSKPGGRPSVVPEVKRSESKSPEPPARPSFVSPFAADSARKGGPKSQMVSESTVPMSPRLVSAATGGTAVVMGSAAPAEQAEAEPPPDIAHEQRASIELVPAVAENISANSVSTSIDSLDSLRNAVLDALAAAGNRMLISMLETGVWQLDGNDLSIRVASSATLIDMSMGSEARRLMIASASGALGRPVRLKVSPGEVTQSSESAAPEASTARAASNGTGGRSRAEQDPIVRLMKEKFGAEIRTIIDYKNHKDRSR